MAMFCLEKELTPQYFQIIIGTLYFTFIFAPIPELYCFRNRTWVFLHNITSKTPHTPLEIYRRDSDMMRICSWNLIQDISFHHHRPLQIGWENNSPTYSEYGKMKHLYLKTIIVKVSLNHLEFPRSCLFLHITSINCHLSTCFSQQATIFERKI